MRENSEGSAYGRTLSKSLRRTRGLRPAQKAVSDKAAAFREGGRTSPGTRLLTRSFRCRQAHRQVDPLLNQHVHNMLTCFYIFFKSLAGTAPSGPGTATEQEERRPGRGLSRAHGHAACGKKKPCRAGRAPCQRQQEPSSPQASADTVSREAPRPRASSILASTSSKGA